MALPALLSHDDLVKFRTRFCERYLSYGECNFGGKCQYSHNLLWRRRSPQKHSYEPRLCENLLLWTGANGKRQSTLNCHLGKNCRFAHSREEVLYHPSVYKTLLCDSTRCTRYYCPFAHAVGELQSSPDGLEYVRACMGGYRDQRDLFTDESGSEDEANEVEFHVENLFDRSACYQTRWDASYSYPPSPQYPPQALRLRKASVSSNSSMLTAPRLSFSNTDWAENSGNCITANSWVQVTPTLRVETVVRAHSPVAASELCRAVLLKPDKKGVSNGGSQQALAKVMQIEEGQDASYVAISNELQSLCRSEHKNILSIRKVHAGRSPGNGGGRGAWNGSPLRPAIVPNLANAIPLNSIGSPAPSSAGIVLCIAFEQCATSLYQLVVDGYRGFSFDGKVKSVAKRINPHDGTLTPTAVAKIGDLLSALQRLHFIGISHLRISPTNILVDSEASFKLGDFLGKYKLVHFLEREKRRDYAELFLQDSVSVWLAPEIVNALKEDEQKRKDPQNLSGKRADVWSLGVCIFFAMTGQHPYGIFGDEEKSAASGALALTSPPESLFVGGVDTVLKNAQDGNFLNQNLLYDLPLVLDLIMRLVGKDGRLDANELSRHPIFWDYAQTSGFISGLPLAKESNRGNSKRGAIFKSFSDYALRWGFFLTSEERTVLGPGNSYPQTVLGLLNALQEAVARGDPRTVGPVVLRILQRHPLALVRAWDGMRLEGLIGGIEKYNSLYSEAFSRPSQNWMEGNNAAGLSHEFVREYYLVLFAALSGVSPGSLVPKDKMGSAGLGGVGVVGEVDKPSSSFGGGILIEQDVKSARTETCESLFGGLPPRAPRNLEISKVSSNPWQPPVQTPKGPLTPSLITPNSEAIRQVAAASAALATVFENPGVISVISGNGGTPTYNDQLVAAASIYANLLAGNFSPGTQPLFDPRKMQDTNCDEGLFLRQEQLAQEIADTLG